MSDSRKSCKQLVHKHLRSRIETLEILWNSRRVGENGYEEVKELYERQEALKEKYPKKPRKGSQARAEYDDEAATIEAEVSGLDGEQEFLYEHFQEAEDLGGCEAYQQYGLSLDYVEWDEEHQYGDFICWLLSTGGPGDEFNFYTTMNGHLRWVEYRYKDWFDGAGQTLKGTDEKLLREIFEDFRECGVIDNILRKHRDPCGALQ